MKKKAGILMTVLLSGTMILSLTACQNQSSVSKETETAKETKTETEPEKGTMPETGQKPEETPDETKEEDKTTAPTGGGSETETNDLRMKVVFPENVTVQKSEDGQYAETEEYLLYVFYEDTAENGAVYDPFEVVSYLNSEGQEQLAKDVLHLKEYEISEEQQPVSYEKINDMQGVFFPFSKMIPDIEGREMAEGEGFAMIYGRTGDIGVYVVLGVIKNSLSDASESHKEELTELLKTSAFSLKEMEEKEADYVVFRETMEDGTDLRAAYRTGRIEQIENRPDGIRLYYDEDQTGYFLIRHEQKGFGIPSEEFFHSLKENLNTNEGVTLSEEKTTQGKMPYHQVRVSYQSMDQDRLEIVSLTSDEDGSVWIIDLCGSKEQVQDHEEDLKVLLWSFEEE